MHEILKLIQDNPIDYPSVILNAPIISIDRRKSYAFNVVIPVRGRSQFLAPLLDSLMFQIDRISVAITVVEHSTTPEHYHIAKRKGIDYIWIQSDGPFNKCLAFNIGVILGAKSTYIVCHDLDMLVQPNFFTNILGNFFNKASAVVQSFNKRRVIYCSKELTDDLIGGDADVMDLREGQVNTFVAPGKAPGGSITMSRNIFFEVGGYDPELFHGYAPEDKFIWDKISTLHNIGSCDNPVVEVFHMHHEPTMNTNPDFHKMRAISDKFSSLKAEEKLQIIEDKRSLISQYQ